MFCTGAFAAPSVRQLGNIAQKQIESKAAEKSSANAIPLPIKARVATPMITKATSSSTFSKTKTVSTDSKRLPNIKPSSYTGNTSTNTNTNTTPTTVTQKSQTITYLSELNTSIQNLNNSVENKTSQLESQIATTKTDLEGQIENAVSDKATTTELAGAKSELQGSIASTKTALEGTIAGTKTDLEGTIASTKSDLETEINKKANQLLVDSIVSVFDKDSDNNLTNVKVDYIPASIPTSKIANLDTKIADLDEIKGTLNDSENGFAKVKEKAFGALQKNSLEGELNTYVTTNKLVNETFVTDQIDAIDLSDYATNDAVDTKFSLLDFKVEDEKVKFTTDNEQWTDVAPVSAFGGTPGCAPTIDSEEVTDEEGKKSLKLTITPCEGVAYDKFIPYGEKGADACDIRILKSKVAGITTLTAKDCEDNVKWTETIEDGETPTQCTLTKTTQDIKDSNNKKIGTKLTITDSCDPDNPTVIDVDDGQDGEIPTDYATPDDIEDLYDAIDELEIPDVPGNIDKIAEKFDNNGELIVEQLPESMKSALAAGSEARSFFDNEGKIDASNLRGTINNNNLSSCQSVTYDYNVGKPTTANVTLPAGFDTPDAGYNAASTALGYVVETTTNPCVSGFVPAMRKLNDSCDATYPFSTKTASYNIHRCSHQNGELNNGMISATLYYWIEQVTSSNSLAVQMNQAAATAASAVETANSANSAAQLASSTAGTVAGYFKKGEDDQVYLDTNHLSNVPSSAIAFNQTQNSVFNNFATVQNTANSLAQAVNGVDCNGVDGPCTASAGLLSKFNAIVQAFQDAGMLTMNCTGGSCTATATAKPNNNEPSM